MDEFRTVFGWNFVFWVKVSGKNKNEPRKNNNNNNRHTVCVYFYVLRSMNEHGGDMEKKKSRETETQ